MTGKEQALRLTALRVLKDLLKEADDADREAVAAEWIVGDRLAGAIGRKPVGHVQLKNGAVGAAVDNKAAFEAWVKENRPDEMETVVTTVTRVRPAYQSAVLTAAKQKGVAVTAEGMEIPGITVETADPVVAVTLADDALEVVRAAWESGELWELLGGLLPALAATPVVEVGA